MPARATLFGKLRQLIYEQKTVIVDNPELLRELRRFCFRPAPPTDIIDEDPTIFCPVQNGETEIAMAIKLDRSLHSKSPPKLLAILDGLVSRMVPEFPV